MEKIGLISDTHNNMELLKDMAEYLVYQEEIDRFYHCGDDYTDADGLLNYSLPLIRVPGIFETLYKEKTVPVIQSDEVEGWRLCLLHDLKDLTPEVLQWADIIVYGHSHDYAAEMRDGKLYINPGHLKELSHKERPASFGILNLANGKISVKIFGLNKEILLEENFSF